jgi:hypothetical protein
MKRVFLLSATASLLGFAGCTSPAQPNQITSPAATPATNSCSPSQVFTLEQEHTNHGSSSKERPLFLSWRLKDPNNDGALHNQPARSGEVLEWHSNPRARGTSFGIAVPLSSSITWTVCGAQGQWYSNLTGFFPSDFAVVNAWQEGSGDYVLRLQVTNSQPQTNFTAWYKIVVPQYTNSMRIAPYDYFMVDATLDVSQDRK